MFIKIFLPIIFFIVGTIFASFSNMLMYRLAYNKPVLKDSRSYCPKCGASIHWYDNIPLLSYLILKGKCRHCHNPISIRYFLVELYGGISFVIIYLLYICLLPNKSFEVSNNAMDFINAVTISFTLLFLLISAYVDHVKKEIPYSMMIILGILAITNFVSDLIIYRRFNLDRVLGFAIPLTLFLLIYLICFLIFKKEPMGLGDIIVFSILGLLFGGLNLLSIVLVSSLTCSVIEIIKIKKTGEKKEIPFIPYIYIGTFITATFTPYVFRGIEKLIGGF